jgi:hypothetical protein
MNGVAIEYRRLRAPTEDRTIYIDPPLLSVADYLGAGITRSRPTYDLQGRSLVALSHQARRELIESAHRYTAQYRNLLEQEAGGTAPLILMSGHQPELYHPGVWFKNFAMSAAARALDAYAVNLLIDNDVFRTPGIRVPHGSGDAPEVSFVSFDQSGGETPFEDRFLQDRRAFDSFGHRVGDMIRPLVAQPLVESFWPLATAAVSRTNNIGQALSQARHTLEGQWGLSTVELPLSSVCRQEPFRWFVAHLLAELPRFREIHNDSLGEYRRVHRLRSKTHPVPELTQRDDWMEAPFWIWTQTAPQRKRLMVRFSKHQVELAGGDQVFGHLSLHADCDAAPAVEQMGRLESDGIRIRPRALLTTMFARLMLSDLFIHGIGGAKYDQLTDVIVQRFFGMAPPAFFTVTATLRLPAGRSPTNRDDLRQVESLLRDLRFNPQRHVSLNDRTEPLVAAKAHWIQKEPEPQGLKQRHMEIERVNQELQPFVASQRRQLLADRQRLLNQLRNERILGSREYSFCLHPEQTLRSLLLDI